MSKTQYAIRNTQYASRFTRHESRATISIQYRESSTERRETRDKRLLIMKNSICETRETSDERLSFMQNEPKFKIASIYASPCNTSGYSNFLAFTSRKNEPKRTQNEPNFSPILGSFFPILASFYQEIFAFANISERWCGNGTAVKDNLQINGYHIAKLKFWFYTKIIYNNFYRSFYCYLLLLVDVNDRKR